MSESQIGNQWDRPESDPILDIYTAAIILTDSYEEKKYWGLKLSRRCREKKEKNE